MKHSSCALLSLLVSGCYCSHQPLDDAGSPSDVGVEDAGTDGSGLPPVEPRGPSCAEADVPDTAICVERGWFDLRRWHTTEVFREGPDEDFPTVPPVSVYLDSYALDRREVTSAEFLEFALRVGAAVPPLTCGYRDHEIDQDVLSDLVPERSGWTAGGVPEADHETSPVVCVTRADAFAYCEDRGGRLPTAAELMKAGTTPGNPSATTRFPWGDSPPPETAPPWPGLRGDWYLDYASVGVGSGPDPLPRAPGMAASGRSPRGFDDLVGNVSEFLLDCRGDLPAVYPGDAPLVRPAPPVRASCDDGFVVAGANWRSITNQIELWLAQILFVSDEDQPSGFRYPLDQGILGSPTVSRLFFGRSEPEPDTPVEARGPNRRSWRVGFRCAYDL